MNGGAVGEDERKSLDHDQPILETQQTSPIFERILERSNVNFRINLNFQSKGKMELSIICQVRMGCSLVHHRNLQVVQILLLRRKPVHDHNNYKSPELKFGRWALLRCNIQKVKSRITLSFYFV